MAGDAAEVAVLEPVGIAFEGDDLGVVDESVDHGGGGDVEIIFGRRIRRDTPGVLRTAIDRPVLGPTPARSS